MQRLHEDDPTGHLVARDRGRWHHLRLAMEFEPGNRCETPIWSDPRTEPMELLCEALWPREAVEALKSDAELGPVGYAGQYQQSPSPSDGNLFKRHHWRFWKWPGQMLPPVRVQMLDGSFFEIEAEELPPFEEMFQTWDMSFKETKGSDFVAGGAWGRARARVYLVDIVNDRLGFTKSIAAIGAMRDRWPQTGAIYVEDKANGPAVIDHLKGDVPGMIPVSPNELGEKISRANACQPYVESGNVYLPHPLINGLTNVAIEQAAMFPNGTHDDIVDMLTWAIRLKLVGRREDPALELQPVMLPSDVADAYSYRPL